MGTADDTHSKMAADVCVCVNVCDCQRVKLYLQTVLGMCCSLYRVPDLLQSKSEQLTGVSSAADYSTLH